MLSGPRLIIALLARIELAKESMLAEIEKGCEVVIPL
jgi:hypothetical protein